MPAERPTFPVGKTRLSEVYNPETGHYKVVVRVDGLLPKTIPDYGTDIEDTGLAPQEYSGRYDGYVLTDVKPDETGSNHYYVFEKLPGHQLAGKQQISQFGGGVIDVFTTDVAPGTAAPSITFRTVSAEVKADEHGKSVLVETKLPASDSWPTLKDSEYVSELGLIINTEKTVVANTNQTGFVAGGETEDRVVTEYRPIDKWKTVQIVGKIRLEDINKTWVFRKPIQYSIPDEIPSAPAIIKAYSMKLGTPEEYDPAWGLTKEEWEDLQAFYNQKYVTDAELDFKIVEGYRGPFSAEVTRTISLTPSEEEEFVWKPQAERMNVAVTLAAGSLSSANGKILRFSTPSAIHGEWSIEVADVFTVLGTRVWVWKTNPDGSRGALKAGYPVDVPFGNVVDLTDAGRYWRTREIVDKETITVGASATTPSSVPHGQQIIAAVNSEQWRFGLWVNDVYRVRVP